MSNPAPNGNGWVGLYAALYGDGRQDDQHWALWVENKGVIQALSLASWRVQVAPGVNPRNSGSFSSLMYLGDVEASDWDRMGQIANTVRLNPRAGWNCQDYVMDLLGALEHQRVITTTNEYEEYKDRLRQQLHRRT